MKKILKYSFIGLAALCTALLCGGYYMLGHALNPDELITRSRNSQASYEYMFGQYPELKGGQPADGRGAARLLYKE